MPGNPRKRNRRKRDPDDPKRRKATERVLAEVGPLAEIQEGTEAKQALQSTLDQSFSMLKSAHSGVSTLREDELWRDTMYGRIPNEWIRLERNLRRETVKVAGRMLDLEMDGRKVKGEAVIADALTSVVEHVFNGLELSKVQRKRLPDAVEAGMKLLFRGK